MGGQVSRCTKTTLTRMEGKFKRLDPTPSTLSTITRTCLARSLFHRTMNTQSSNSSITNKSHQVQPTTERASMIHTVSQEQMTFNTQTREGTCLALKKTRITLRGSLSATSRIEATKTRVTSTMVRTSTRISPTSIRTTLAMVAQRLNCKINWNRF